MTAYHGGKQKMGKGIANVIHKISTEMEEDGEMDIVGYCEPFVGMAGVYQHIPELFKDHKPKLKYKAGDTNKSVILMWKGAQRGWKPPKTCAKQKYERLRHNGQSSAEKGFVGHAYGFGGQYFKGFTASKICRKKAVVKMGNNIVRISKLLRQVVFTSGDYNRYSSLRNYIIYCDPPYSSFSYYPGDKGSQNIEFDHQKFWKWCRKMSENNIVFVSEYKAPKGFELVWSKRGSSGTNARGNSPHRIIEKLYMI